MLESSEQEVISNEKTPNPAPLGEGKSLKPADIFAVSPTIAMTAKDADLQANLGAHIEPLNTYAIPAMGNMRMPTPGIATTNYNPVEQQNPGTGLENLLDRALQSKSLGVGQNPIDPLYFGIKQERFQRYFEHPKFAEIGFTPYSNNESFYNANSDIYDDMSRMSGQFTSLAGAGIMSTYRSIGDIFSGDILSPDLESAEEFEQAMMIGNSSRGGLGGWTNNFLLNSAYTVGIISSIAIEELALGAATVVSAGAFGPAAALKTAFNATRIGKALFNSRKFLGGTRNIMSNLNTIDKARDFYTASKIGKRGLNGLGKIFTPNLVRAMKNVKTAENATQGAMNLAKMQAGFGGFYRDMRAVNLALAESKLEGGMVYNNLLNTGLQRARIENMGELDSAEIQRISDQASEGAFYTTLANAPLIYASNFFVLGNANSGFTRSLNRTFRQTSTTGAAKRAFRTTTNPLTRSPFIVGDKGVKGFLQKIKAGTLKGNGGMAAASTLRYFAANVAEGIQEVSQEAISAATTGYYTALMRDPLAGGVKLRSAMISKGMSEQFSGQGFSVFMSGFLMGGLVQGPQKLFFQGGPALVQRITDPKGYKESKVEEEKNITKLVKSLNKSYNSQIESGGQEGIGDIEALNFFNQKQISDKMKADAFAEDRLGFQDGKDDSRFAQMMHVLANGKTQIYRDQLESFLQLSNTEYTEAFPNVSAKDIAAGKHTVSIKNQIDALNKMEDNYLDNLDVLVNPNNPDEYEFGTAEYQQSAFKYKAWEHARYLMMFTKDGFTRALERSESIFQRLSNDPLFNKMAASDVTLLLSPESISNEIVFLIQELKLLTDSVGEGKMTNKQKKDLKFTKDKILKLGEYSKILTDPKNLFKDGTFKRGAINKLRPVFKRYVKLMAGQVGSFADNSAINAALEEMVDHNHLEGRGKVYDRAIEFMANPDKFQEIVDRAYKFNKEAFQNKNKEFVDTIKEYKSIQEANDLMNKIASQDVYFDIEETKRFLTNGNIDELKTFYDDKGSVTMFSNKVKYDSIMRILEDYRKQTGQDVVEKEATTEEVNEEVVNESRSIQDQILEDAGINIVLTDINNTPFLNNLLAKKHREYAGLKLKENETPLSFKEWSNTAEAKNIINTFRALKKIWINGTLITDVNGNDTMQIPNQNQIETEKGFSEWLSTSAKVSDVAGSVLKEAQLELVDFVEPVVSNESEEIENQDGSSKKIVDNSIKENTRIDVMTAPTDQGGVVIYRVLDKNGRSLPELLYNKTNSLTGSYNTLKEAQDAQDIIEAEVPDSSLYEFDGTEGLYQGQLVYKDNEEFYILSNQAQVNNNETILLRSSKDQKEIRLGLGDFTGVYTAELNNYELYASDVARYNISELIQPHPHLNESGENLVGAQSRYNLIVSILTPEELSQVQLIIELDPNHNPNNGEQYQFGSFVANPMIKSNISKYKIGFYIPEQLDENGNAIGVTKKINDALEAAGLDQSDKGIFGYLPNNNLALTNRITNTNIQGTTMTLEEANNIVLTTKNLRDLNDKQRLAAIHETFAKNTFLLSELNKLTDFSRPYTQEELGIDVKINLQAGNTSYKQRGNLIIERAINELDFQYADNNNNYLIFDWAKINRVRTENFVTNLEFDPATELKERVTEALKAQGDYVKMQTGSDRYYAAILLPNGRYGLVTLVAKSYTSQELGIFRSEILTRAETTIKENVDKQGRTKDSLFNSKEGGFNETGISEILFISTNKEGYKVGLQITPWGSLQMDLYNTNTKSKVENSEVEVKISLSEKNNPTKIFDSLIKKFNESKGAVKSKILLDNSDFRKTFPTGVSPAVLIDNTTTKANSKILENQKIEISVSGEGVQAINTLESIPSKISDKSKDMSNRIAALSEMPSNTSDPLDRLKEDIAILQEELLKDTEPSQRNKILQSSKEYKDLIKKLRDQERSANKVLSNTLDETEIEDINVFMDWADRNLPDYIALEDITTLGNNLKAGGERVGAFVFKLNQMAGGVNVNGTIYTGALSPFKYHEAFHGVFRLILTDEEITKYRSIARKEVRAKLRSEGKSFSQELQRLRNSADTYTDMSDKELENEYYEEYMADEFEKFKMGPKNSKTDANIKSLFNRIMDWIRSVFSTYTPNELQTLFEKIDSGKYKGAQAANNEFTQSIQKGVTVEANALVPYNSDKKIVNGKRIQGYLYLDSDIASGLVSSIAAMYIERVQAKTVAYSPADELNELVNDFAWLYSLENPINEFKTDVQKYHLANVGKSFDRYYDDILEGVYSYLNAITDQVEEETYNAEFFQNESGLRTTSQFDKDASMIGGFKSLPSKVRQIIATTSIREVDFFGNKVLSIRNGVPENLIIPVDFVKAYNGLLKSVQNLSDPKEILQSMYFFGLDNPQAGAVVNKLLSTVGVTSNQLLSDASLDQSMKQGLNNGLLLQSFIKGFTNFRVDYIFNQKDLEGNVLLYSASERDDINSQLDRWAQAYVYKKKQLVGNKTRKDQVKKVLDQLKSALVLKEDGSSKAELSDKLLSDKASEYSQKIYDYIGIKLSPLYIQFSLLQNRSVNTEKQNALLRLYKNNNPLTAEQVNELGNEISGDVNIFDNVEGMSSRLNQISIGNAAFDETIGATVFRNPNGDLVYAHQYPTYHLKKIASLNNEGALDALKNADPYLERNYLLNNLAFRSMSADNMLKIIRVAGSKTSITLEQVDSGSNIIDTSTFGNFTQQEFILSLLNSYTLDFNTKNNKMKTLIETVNETNEKEFTALAPIFIRVLEASNTGDKIALPIIKAVNFSNGKTTISNEALDILVGMISIEFDRMVREHNPVTASEEGILGFNTKAFKDGEYQPERAFEFFDTGTLLDTTIKIQLQGVAREAKAGDVNTLDQALKLVGMPMNEFRNMIATELDKSFDVFNTRLDTLGIRNQISNKVRNGLVDSTKVKGNELNKSQDKLNLNNNEVHNLKQIYINSFINTKSINQVLLGDQAISLEDAVNQVKRAKAQNAALISASSKLLAPGLGITEISDDISLVTLSEPKGISSVTGSSIDRADAQMYITTKAFRYMFFGFGKLSPQLAKVLNEIEAGIPLKSEDVFGVKGYAEMQQLLNSKKLVYADGQTYLKMSAITLTKELTSNFNEDTQSWEAKPSKVKLHNLRVKLEAIEVGKKTIGIAAPLSAVKMRKQRVKDIAELLNDNEFTTLGAGNDVIPNNTTLSREFMGLQVVNPSNKLEGVDTSQIKVLITSEHDNSTFVKALDMSIGDIRREYNIAMAQRVMLSYKNKRNLIFSFDTAMDEFEISNAKGSTTPQLNAFLNYAVAGLKASQSSSNLIDFFTMENGDQKFNLNNPLSSNKFEQLLLSYFSKGVLAERVPGMSLTLVSDFGVNIYRRVFTIENGVPQRSEIIREKTWASLKNKPALVDIEFLTQEDIPVEGAVVIDRLRSGVMSYDSKGEPLGERYIESILPAHYKDVMDLIENNPEAKIPDVISKTFAVRVPSQDFHSTMPVKMVDFLPVFYGSSAVFAQELVEISGADFDVDKVFSLIKEFYVSDGEFIEYGKNDDNAYNEYKRYISNKVELKGTIYSEALGLRTSGQVQSKIENTANEAEYNYVTDNGLSENGLKALQILGLPITKQQYDTYKAKFGEPYSAPLNNLILDYRYSMSANDNLTSGENPIAYSPANTDIITTTLALLESNSPIIKARNSETGVDVDTLLGKLNAFAANKGASIGAIVLPNLNLSLLTEYKTEIKGDNGLEFNGIPYKKFGVGVNSNGQRTQDTLSALITMATDNAKLRLVAKTGVNKNALSVLANMTSLGVPLYTSLLLINNPVIQDLYSQATNKKGKFDPGFLTLLKSKYKLLKVKGVKPIPLTDEILLKEINDNQVTNVNIDVLAQYIKAAEIQEFTAKMSAVTGLSQSLGKNIAEVNKKAENIKELLSKEAMMDLSEIYKGKTWQSSVVKIFNQLTNDLLPNVLLTSNLEFTEIVDKVIANMTDKSLVMTEDVKSSIRLDLLSYLTISAYMKNYEGISQERGTLNNSLIYPNEGNKSIVDIIQTLRETESGQKNAFLMDFLILEKSNDPNNNTGLNLALANTFRNLTPSQKVDVQNDFAKLFNSIDTKIDATSILNYMMVKDGLQLAYQGLTDSVSPYLLSGYLAQINSVEEVFKGNESFESVFKMSKQELTDEFSENYLISSINGPRLKTYVSDSRPGGSVLPSNLSWVTGRKSVIFNDFSSEDADVPTQKYIRIEAIDNFGNSKFYSYKEDTKSFTKSYSIFEPEGSNLQNGIGFMFNGTETGFKRPTNEKLKSNVKFKNEKGQTDVSQDTETKTDDANIQERAMNFPGANIVQTDKETTIQISPESETYNISNTAKLLEAMSEESDIIRNIVEEAEGLKNTRESLPEASELEEGLNEEISSEYPLIDNYWNTEIANNVEASKAMRTKNNVVDLEGFVELYTESTKKGETLQEKQQNFIDQIKKCNLR